MSLIDHHDPFDDLLRRIFDTEFVFVLILVIHVTCIIIGVPLRRSDEFAQLSVQCLGLSTLIHCTLLEFEHFAHSNLSDDTSPSFRLSLANGVRDRPSKVDTFAQHPFLAQLEFTVNNFHCRFRNCRMKTDVRCAKISPLQRRPSRLWFVVVAMEDNDMAQMSIQARVSGARPIAQDVFSPRVPHEMIREIAFVLVRSTMASGVHFRTVTPPDTVVVDIEENDEDQEDR